MKRLLPFVIIIAVLAVAVGAGRWYMQRSTQKAGPAKAASPELNATAFGATPGAQPAHARGPENAPVILEEFGDFECPPCGALYPVLKTLESDYHSQMRVVFREFPLTPPHVHALAAARAAEAAGLQGRFFEMHDLLYENQKSWKDVFDVRPIFEDYARRIGLDVERWKADQEGEIVARRITLDGSRGHSLGVKGTPTVFLNNQEIPFEQLTPDGLRTAINKALSPTGP
jgi:formate-nitrite transporter family protein